MDGFNKMATTEAPAPKFVQEVEGSNGMFRGILALQTASTITTASCTAVIYWGLDDVEHVLFRDTMLAILLCVASANALLSLINVGGEISNGGKKKRLENRVLNSVRNMMTLLSFIAGMTVYGLEENAARQGILIGLLLTRVFDVMLDIGGLGKQIQCADERDKGNMKDSGNGKTLLASFVFLTLGTSFVLLLVYIIDVAVALDGSTDDTLLWISIFTVALHLILLMLTLAMRFDIVANCLKKLLGESKCPDATVHSLNEIPLISAAVFTFNLLCVCFTLGSRVDQGQSVNLLGSVLAIMAVADIGARRMV